MELEVGANAFILRAGFGQEDKTNATLKRLLFFSPFCQVDKLIIDLALMNYKPLIEIRYSLDIMYRAIL
jgi:hypothetical protein